MILPPRHGRGANRRRIGGYGSRVAIVRSAAAATASSCVLADGQATVCPMDLRALEEWGKGKGEKGGEDLVKDEYSLSHRAATTLARGGHRRLIGSDDHVGESSSSSSS